MKQRLLHRAFSLAISIAVIIPTFLTHPSLENVNVVDEGRIDQVLITHLTHVSAITGTEMSTAIPMPAVELSRTLWVCKYLSSH